MFPIVTQVNKIRHTWMNEWIYRRKKNNKYKKKIKMYLGGNDANISSMICWWYWVISQMPVTYYELFILIAHIFVYESYLFQW